MNQTRLGNPPQAPGDVTRTIACAAVLPTAAISRHAVALAAQGVPGRTFGPGL